MVLYCLLRLLKWFNSYFFKWCRSLILGVYNKWRILWVYRPFVSFLLRVDFSARGEQEPRKRLSSKRSPTFS